MVSQQTKDLITNIKLESLFSIIESAHLSDHDELKDMYLAEALDYVDEWLALRGVKDNIRE